MIQRHLYFFSPLREEKYYTHLEIDQWTHLTRDAVVFEEMILFHHHLCKDNNIELIMRLKLSKDYQLRCL